MSISPAQEAQDQLTYQYLHVGRYVQMTDDEMVADGWSRINPPERGTYGDYIWRRDGIRYPCNAAKFVLYKK